MYDLACSLIGAEELFRVVHNTNQTCSSPFSSQTAPKLLQNRVMEYFRPWKAFLAYRRTFKDAEYLFHLFCTPVIQDVVSPGWRSWLIEYHCFCPLSNSSLWQNQSKVVWWLTNPEKGDLLKNRARLGLFKGTLAFITYKGKAQPSLFIRGLVSGVLNEEHVFSKGSSERLGEENKKMEGELKGELGKCVAWTTWRKCKEQMKSGYKVLRLLCMKFRTGNVDRIIFQKCFHSYIWKMLPALLLANYSYVYTKAENNKCLGLEENRSG